ncbi:MAG TPA: DUF4337 domain-containing protein [Planctomycetota bacterium]|nr:DUF4337 domain-containing protein [Planctomycetota bacterium]
MADDMDKPRTSPATEAWITRTTAILAVLAALSSGRWGASNLGAILEQGKINDTWGEFQAESIKGHAARDAADLAKALHADDAVVKKFQDEEASRKKQKDELKGKAEEFQLERDAHIQRSFWFEMAFACLQLGVVICTIAAATKSKGLWMGALVIAAIGLGVFVNGFKLWYRVEKNPLIEKQAKSLDADAK